MSMSGRLRLPRRETRVSALFLLLLMTWLMMCVRGAEVLEKLVVLHRHGARTPMGVVNGKLDCTYPYCQLTDEGKEMCRTLGRYLDSTYNDSGLLSLPALYNVSFISSQSTDYSRVVVSAEAVIMGLYEGSGNALPFVDFVPNDVNVDLCMWQSWPTWVLRDTYSTELHVDDAWVESFIGTAHLALLGQTFGLEEMCASAPTDCVGFVQDAVACNMSAGIPVPEWIAERYEDYRVVVSRFLARILGYFPQTSEYSAQIGSLGFPFMQTVFGFLTNPSTGLMQVQHYAAHDWTLLAVYTALGMWSPADMGNTTFVPRFAETLILELWNDGTGSQQLRGYWGYPDQLPGNHTFAFRLANISCLSSSGTLRTTWNSPSGWCSLGDVWRFVNTTAPQSPLGVCYSTNDLLDAQDCNSDDAPPKDSHCYFYRKHCPQVSCGSTNGAIADAARGYLCQTQQLGKDVPFMAATVVALVAPSVLAGAIFGFYFGNRLQGLLWRFRSGSSAEESKPIAQEAAGSS